MKQVLHKPKTSGRLTKWVIELSEFSIRYKPRTAIKGQILADFVMEFTTATPPKTTQLTPDLPVWKLSVNGAANSQGRGTGLILTSPEGVNEEYALRFWFSASNNEVEYEAVIAGLNLAHSMEVEQLEVCSDSQKFHMVQVRHVPRMENSWANALAKLATASQEDLERRVPVEHLMEPLISVNSDEVLPVMTALSWMDPI